MSYETIIYIVTIVFVGISALIVLTNILTQLFKKIINREEFPAQAIVFLIAEILTFLSVAIGLQILGRAALWYYWVLTFLVGCFVAYGAIFGYDNLYSQLFQVIKNLINAIFKRGASS